MVTGKYMKLWKHEYEACVVLNKEKHQVVIFFDGVF